MRKSVARALASVLVGLGAAHFAGATELAAYRPVHGVAGEIRIWGSAADAGLLRLWEAGFRAYHPKARFAVKLYGHESALASLYTDVADVAFVGRELRTTTDNMAFQWVKLYRPTTIEVANAGVKSDRLASNLAVFVHRDNPLAGLTLAQLDGIFGAEHRRSPANLRTWGDVGLGGEWRDRPIRVLAPRIDSIPALFFRETVLGNSRKWNPVMEEFADESQALAALARDPGGIAYAPLAAANESVKALPLAGAKGGALVALTADTAADRSYPLSRAVIVAIDRAPGKPVDARVREFLRYVLSAEGQAAVARDGAYVPLNEDQIAKQFALLE